MLRSGLWSKNVIPIRCTRRNRVWYLLLASFVVLGFWFVCWLVLDKDASRGAYPAIAGSREKFAGMSACAEERFSRVKGRGLR